MNAGTNRMRLVLVIFGVFALGAAAAAVSPSAVLVFTVFDMDTLYTTIIDVSRNISRMNNVTSASFESFGFGLSLHRCYLHLTFALFNFHSFNQVGKAGVTFRLQNWSNFPVVRANNHESRFSWYARRILCLLVVRALPLNWSELVVRAL